MSAIVLDRSLTALLLVLPILAMVFTRGLNFESSNLTHQSSLLAFPLAAGAYLLYMPESDLRGIILASSQTLMMLGLLLMRLPAIQEKTLNWGEKSFYVLALIPLLFLIKPSYVQTHFWPSYLAIIAGMLAVLASLLVPALKLIEQKYHKLAVMFLFGAQLSLLPAFHWANFASILMHGACYLCFFIHFYHASVDHLRARTIEADTRLMEWERSIRREVNKRIYEIEKSNSRLIDMAKVDSMTQVYNKVNIINIITALTDDRQQRPFTILMFDIDNFKQINDTRGHLTGDMIIKQVANTACSSVRGIDSVGRYGGDEFIIALPNTNVSDAQFVAERLRKKVAENESLACTISIGLATFPLDGTSARDLIQAADEGLYISKQRGRNTVSRRDTAVGE